MAAAAGAAASHRFPRPLAGRAQACVAPQGRPVHSPVASPWPARARHHRCDGVL